MKRFRTSELVFILIGLILMISSALLLKSNFSLVRYFNLHLSPGDPFQASYYAASDAPRPTPIPTPIPTPAPIPLSQAVIADSTEISFFLISPANQTIITHSKRAASPEKVLFKFEVHPPKIPLTFEIYLKNSLIYSEKIPANATGKHEIRVEIPHAGLYRWQLKGNGFISDSRGFVFREH